MVAGKTYVTTGGDITFERPEEFKGCIHVHVHVWILVRPIDKSGALGDFMPDHACLAILIAKDKLKFLASLRVVADAQGCVRSDHAISCEKPIVLRPSGIASRTVAGDKSRANNWIVDP